MVDNPLVLRIVKVVPKLVEQSAAPAAKAWSGVALERDCRTKERAMGKLIPVIATRVERARLAFRERKLVDSPPILKSEYFVIVNLWFSLRGEDRYLHKLVISNPDILAGRSHALFLQRAISHLVSPMLFR